MQGSNSEYYSQENSHPMIYKLVIVLIYQNTLERMLKPETLMILKPETL